MTSQTEADTCRRFVLPKLYAAGWDDDRISEQRTFTNGRIIVTGTRVRRRKQKRADYLLYCARDFPIAVVEAKAAYRSAGDGLQQAKDYAQILGLKFCYATNGREIIEYDFYTGRESPIDAFPSPDELWARYRAGEKLPDNENTQRLLTPCHVLPGRRLYYYQETAVNRTVQAILQGQKRVLICMATGTGKTVTAFQICWKLWSSQWNPRGEYRKPKILYLADRNILIDQPKDGTFAPFGDARHKIEHGEIVKGREMYFAIYQSIAEDERRPGLYKEFPPDFFDLIIVDECHRGSARDESSWRVILEHFSGAAQIGMTATPLRSDNATTYRYFGKPIYQYSLRQGIDDGFLAPYRVHRIVTTVDATGWRPSQGDLDRFGREIPDDLYSTPEFERVVAMLKRTEAIAEHIAKFMKKTDRYAKTIVFCVDQEHADEMRRAIGNANRDLMQSDPNYTVRITSEEGQIGKGHLSRFQDVETNSPIVVTTSKLLTTGVDIPTAKNIVLARMVGSMVEFKQIIGRGTRVRDDYNKLYFNILDYTGSATRLFADPEFDGDPVMEIEEDDEGENILDDGGQDEEDTHEQEDGDDILVGPPSDEHRKYYYDGGQVEIAADVAFDLDTEGKRLRVRRYTDYTAEGVRSLCPTAAELKTAWGNLGRRNEIIEKLADRGIDFEHLAEVMKQPDADPFDLLCHVTFNAPIRTRRERAERMKKDKKDFFDQYGPDAKAILEELLEKYAEHGDAQFQIPDVLQVPPISTHGNIMEISEKFGGADKLREAVERLQNLLYAA